MLFIIFIIIIFLEILGPNKDITNVDTEIKEAEEFLSEDQINIIRSIVGPISIPQQQQQLRDEEPTTSKLAVLDDTTTKRVLTEEEKEKWNNLRPTLRSFGFGRPNNARHTDDYDEDDEEDDDEDNDEDDEDEDEDEDGEEEDKRDENTATEEKSKSNQENEPSNESHQPIQSSITITRVAVNKDSDSMKGE